MSPIRQISVHQRDEAGVMTTHQQVHHLVDDDVFETLRRLLREIGVEADAAGLGLQLPHFVFIRCTKNRSTLHP